MKASEILKLQNDIVTSISDLIPSEWTMFVLNFEIIEGESGNLITDRICFWVNEVGEDFNSDNLSLTLEIEDKLLALRFALKESESCWAICDLTVLSSGKYEYDFSFSGPKRLLGTFNFDSIYRFDSHKEEYKRRMVNNIGKTANKLLKRKNNSWPSLRDYIQRFFSA